ncbi:hypothetical protein AB6A40_002929 [Gnathostoma spinigerum]|uniref:WD repeat-containing protein 4 homolog n=1 Tax=Gnathostoma spinigerum TaxID=75299 RepID=A0ABD6E808_9BILA
MFYGVNPHYVAVEWNLFYKYFARMRCTKEKPAEGIICGFYQESESVEKPILGHLSMLLDMAISEDGRYVLTSDRDEKLRISRYPQTFVIHQYCLSHSSYINCVNVFKDVCFTSGGDGLILAWNIDDGSLLCTESTFRNQPVRCTRIRPSSEDVVRIGCALKDSSVVHVFEYSRSRNAFRNIKVVECTGVVYDMTFVSGRDCLLVLTRNGLWSASLSHELQTTSVSGITKQLYDAISQSRYEFVSMEKNVMFNNVEKYLEKKEDREKQRKRKREISA